MRSRFLEFTHYGLVLAMTAAGVSACKTRTSQNVDSSVKIKAADTGITDPFDVNDVSILFPLDLITNSQSLKMGNFMTGDQLKKVLEVGRSAQMVEFSSAGGVIPVRFSNTALSIDNWRIVSFRVDTCAPGSHAAAGLSSGDQATRDRLCSVQIRLVAQPFSASGQDQDETFHLLYNQPKTPAALAEFLVGLDGIRKAAGGTTTTAGVPLSVHPGLTNASTRAATFTAIETFLSNTASPAKLSNLAVMALAGGGIAGPEPWVFFAMSNLPKAGGGRELKLTSIPTVDKQVQSTAPATTTEKGFFQALSFRTTEHVLGQPSKTPFRIVPKKDGNPEEVEIVPIPNPILNRSTKVVFDGPGFDTVEIGSLDAAKMKVLHEVDNPKPNDFFSMDCVSCHTAGNLMMRRLAALGDEPTPERELITSGKTEGRFSIPKGVTGYSERDTLPTQGLRWSVRNFGYFNNQPTVGKRTATESAEVAHEINTENLRLQDSGPNSCKTIATEKWENDIEPKLWTCMSFGPETPSECFMRFCSPGSGGAEPQ
jgi:hypothetical protein